MSGFSCRDRSDASSESDESSKEVARDLLGLSGLVGSREPNPPQKSVSVTTAVDCTDTVTGGSKGLPLCCMDSAPRLEVLWAELSFRRYQSVLTGRKTAIIL